MRMRKCIGVLMVFTFLLTFGTTAKAASGTWVSGNVGGWSNAANWSSNPALPGLTDTATINNGTATLDAFQQVGIVLMGNGLATDVATLNIDTGANLTITRNTSTQLLGLSKAGNATSVINHSAGTVRVYRADGTNGEVRLADLGNPVSANYNLSGSGVLDTQILNRGDKSRTNANFNATGGHGVLAVRTSIIKWGLVTAGFSGFHQGACILAPGALSTVSATVTTGNSSNEMDYFMDPTSRILFDLGDGNPNPLLSVNDLITAWGNFQIDGELMVNFIGPAPEIGDKWNVWTVESTKVSSYNGSGAFDSLSSNIRVNWISSGNGTDTLQLEYVPEPATIALLGLGLLAIRRNRK